MEYCLICKEIVDKRYEIQVKDNNLENSTSGNICRFCYNKFLDSFYNRSFFKVAKMVNWIKKKDPLRII